MITSEDSHEISNSQILLESLDQSIENILPGGTEIE